ncbi:MAG: serine/threonine protein kinase [Candidatus Obscuribacterales bacterium]|nr:serine/threonine protein kinase [Candidatus Obscuribacterales bacterium]
MPESKDLTGTVIENRFEIISGLGEGGMASVFKAKHQQVDLLVAIKILKKELDFSPTEIERLKREARALNSLFHPNIVKVYSFGFMDDGSPYIVLDYLEGKSLEEIILSGQRPGLDWILEAFMQICRGLSCAHEGGLIHRDLKPSNVMIVPKEEDGSFIKILDFGISRSTSAGDNEQRLTAKGEIFGSPLYISPEQLSGKEIDQRADIYSLGCLMYETLTGRPPFLGDTVFLTLMQHMNEKAKAINEIDPNLKMPEGLEEIVMKCMEKQASARFQSAEELEKALAQCAAGLQI